LKELAQNADDAGASRLALAFLPGWPEARSPLLRGPGLLVANDGPFEKRHANGLTSFGDTSKSGEVGSVGRFGFGQKSVFHLCDAFVFAGQRDSPQGISDVVNPFAEPMDEAARDDRNCLPSSVWDDVHPDGIELLHSAADDLGLGAQRFLQWLPFRRKPDLEPLPDAALIQYQPQADELIKELANPAETAALMSMLRTLRSIEIWRDGKPFLAAVTKTGSHRLLGADKDGTAPVPRPFGGALDLSGAQARSVGLEWQPFVPRLEEIKKRNEWPRTPPVLGKSVPEKAASHGAVVVVRPPGEADELRLGWAVFLPTDPGGDITLPLPSGIGPVRIMLHGYFFLDGGRRNIAWPSGREAADEQTVSRDWNRGLRDEVTLPLLPEALLAADRADLLSGEATTAVVRVLAASPWFEKHRAAVCSRGGVARVLGIQGSPEWTLVSPDAAPLPLPASAGAAARQLRRLLPHLCKEDRTLVVEPEAALLGRPICWPVHVLAEVLKEAEPNELGSTAQVKLLADILDCAQLGAGEMTSVAEPLASLLRSVLASERNLPAAAELKRVLRSFPARLMFRLPTNDVEVRRTLARSGAACVALPPELFDGTFEPAQLSDADARAFLTALDGLLGSAPKEDVERSAAAAALSILSQVSRDPERLAEDPEFAPLRVCRARRADGSGAAILTLAEFVEARRQRRLFRPSPEGVRLLQALAGCITDPQPLIVNLPILDGTQRLELPIATAKACLDLADRATGYGDPAARAAFMGLLKPEAEPEARSALRRLCAGNPVLPLAARLLVPQKGEAELVALLRRAAGGTFHLVPDEIAGELTRNARDALGIQDLSDNDLEASLREMSERLAEAQPTRSESEALLCRNLPVDLLKALPIHYVRNADCRGSSYVRDGFGPIFRKGDWPVPSGFGPHVLLAVAPSDQRARDTQARLFREWDPAAQAEVALGLDAPERYALEILDALAALRQRTLEEPLAARLRDERWLPHNGAARCPHDFLDLPERMENAARATLQAGAAWPTVGSLDEVLTGHPGFAEVRRQLLPDSSKSLRLLAMQVEEAKLVGRLGAPTEFDLIDARRLAERACDLVLPGWDLLGAALTELSQENRWTAQELLPALAVAGPNEAARHLDALAAIAMRAGAEGEAARRMHKAGFVAFSASLIAADSTAQARILGKTLVPTQDGAWREGREVAVQGENVAASHLLEAAWSEALRSGTPSQSFAQAAPATEAVAGTEDDANTARLLANYFESWIAPPGLVVAFIGFVGRSRPFQELAQCRQQGNPRSVEEIWEELDTVFGRHSGYFLPPEHKADGLASWIAHRRYRVTIAPSDTVQAVNLAGQHFSAPRRSGVLCPVDEAATGTVLARTAIRTSARSVETRTLTLAPVDPRGRNLRELADALKAGMRVLLARCYSMVLQDHLALFSDLWRNLSDVSQESIGASIAALVDDLPSILGALRLREDSSIRRELEGLLADRDRDLRRGDEVGANRAKHRSWNKISGDATLQHELLGAIRRRIQDHGYVPQRALLELFQNADDAVGQLDTGGPGEVQVVASGEGVRFVHWGRPINDVGLDSVLAERRGYGRDLANMLRLNLSDKVAGETGRFGLGFKCVHLLTDEPGLASGLLAVRIRAALIPEDWPDGVHTAEQLRDTSTGHAATIIDLPVSDELGPKPAQEAVQQFRKVAALLPLTARHVRRVTVLETGEAPVVASAVRQGVAGAAGAAVIVLAGADRDRRFLALDVGERFEMMLLLGPLGVAAVEGYPRLWHVLPLDEHLACGWLLNGPFAVDSSRSRIAQTEADLGAVLRARGLALGERLVALFDAGERDWQGLAAALGLSRNDEAGRVAFWTSVFDLFARDLDDSRSAALHARERGLGRLLRDRQALPLGLSWSAIRLASTNDRFTRLQGLLAEPAIFDGVLNWPSLARLERLPLSERAGQVLERLELGGPPSTNLASLVQDEARAQVPLDPEHATRMGLTLNNALRHDYPTAFLEVFEVEQAATKLRFRAADGSARAPRDLLLPGDVAASRGAEFQDQSRLAGFAPPHTMLHPDYGAEEALRLFLFARARSGFGFQPAELATWAMSAADDSARRAVLAYLVRGDQRDALGDVLRQRRPAWLPPGFEQVPAALLSGLDEREVSMLRVSLGERFPMSAGSDEGSGGLDGRVALGNAEEELTKIHDWWGHNRERELQTFEGGERGLYPRFFDPEALRGTLGADEQRVAWFTLFAIGAFHTLGRTRDSQHLGFLQAAENGGWWRELAISRPSAEPEPWIARLNEWSEPRLASEAFRPWRNLIADLYAVARWLEEYQEVFLAMPHLVTRDGKLSFSGLLKPSAYAPLARLGVDAGSLDRAFGIGAPFVVRELTRFGVVSPASLLAPYCWVPTRRVRELLCSLGWDGDVAEGRADQSQSMYAFVRQALGSERADFHGDFCLPLQIWTLKRNTGSTDRADYAAAAE
jgi:hypothetical protein